MTVVAREHNQAQGANRRDAGSGSLPSPAPAGESPGLARIGLAGGLIGLSFVLLGAVGMANDAARLDDHPVLDVIAWSLSALGLVFGLVLAWGLK